MFIINTLSHDFARAICNKTALALRAHAILLLIEKVYSCPFIPKCTQNLVITYTNNNIRIQGFEFCVTIEHVTAWFTLEY